MADGYDVLLRDGDIAHVRPLTPNDRQALHELVDSSSQRSAYLRFFSGGRASAHAYMDKITDEGYGGRALVATLRDRLVAVVECIPITDHVADLAILIDDAAQGNGLGTLLLEHAAIDAADHGVKELSAEVLSENAPMLRVLNDLGLEVRRRVDGSSTEIRIAPAPTTRLAAMIEARDHACERASVARVLAPRSVAVIGASRDPHAVGHRVLDNLLGGGFEGPVYPVNPRRANCYKSVLAIPDRVDLAVVAVPAAHVLEVARESAQAGVAGLVVLTAGFAESGDRHSEEDLLKISRTAGMRLIGPNCLGVVNTALGLNATFLEGRPEAGPVGLMSQSGAIGAALLDQLGVTSFVSVGNKADVSGNDLLEYWEDDDATKVIALYLESFGNPRKFTRIARRVSTRKPIMLVKSGRSDSGGRAVRSHTAAAATPDVAVDALVRASGVIRLDTLQDLVDTARLLSTQPLPRGRRVAIVGNSGGPEAMAADACERYGLAVPELPHGLVRGGPSAALGNPVDLTAEASAKDLGDAVEALVASPEVDAVLVVYTPPFGSGLEATREAIAIATRSATKTVLACVMGHGGMIDGRVPAYAFPEQALAALAHAVRYAEWRPEPVGEAPDADVEAARKIVRAEPDGWLSPATAARLLRCYGITVCEAVAVDSPDAAVEAAAMVGLPAVLKATGPVHKSDVGGVRMNLRTQEEIRLAYEDMAATIEDMTGAILQPQLPAGVEIIVGGVSYPAFGPLVMVGMGGVTGDLLADRAFRVPPVSVSAAVELVGELRCAPLLYGYRGAAPVNVSALAEQIARVGRLLDDLPEVVELDLNPVILTEDGATTVDVRIRLTHTEERFSALRRRLR
ncbi:bifunctional acetate--CoA ligase family protein/GNAT family N-acetyltransferase [Nonomuraea dietziae]|uniref:bifunctional acetate--CoA ligase family protein/GNAT family N-acetyltransferase n=1 Tax=Nonomuraea dietziae TaxID=65515 RepID=UPI0034283F75